MGGGRGLAHLLIYARLCKCSVNRNGACATRRIIFTKSAQALQLTALTLGRLGSSFGYGPGPSLIRNLQLRAENCWIIISKSFLPHQQQSIIVLLERINLLIRKWICLWLDNIRSSWIRNLQLRAWKGSDLLRFLGSAACLEALQSTNYLLNKKLCLFTSINHHTTLSNKRKSRPYSFSWLSNQKLPKSTTTTKNKVIWFQIFDFQNVLIHLHLSIHLYAENYFYGQIV